MAEAERDQGDGMTTPDGDLEFLFHVSQMAEAPTWEGAAAVIEGNAQLFAADVLESLLNAGVAAMQSGQDDLAAALLDARLLLDLVADQGVAGALTSLEERETPKRIASSETVGSICVTA